ncbi:putative dinucleotide-binding enzyme [Lysobacter niabensis]|uniref:Dinucleotide-binding enzyme n=1 Tax=Agrilutibacter niabensis TaxID=380628 RepID=A0ABU1VPE7_9GAMM|nr:NADPH-dependent F420 reductase [Lysobacter niabensis]MDR7098968.1 putative dinucleotide-binding enzyme [Lysobacter niabensis]
MTYAIIGSGAIGSAIATQFARAGLDVQVANSRGPASLQELASKLGHRIKPTVLEQALRADVVFLAVPFASAPATLAGTGNWQDRILVDATNAVEFPSFRPIDLAGRLSSQVIGELVPGARIVKAFNTLPAAILASDPRKQGGRRTLFLSGDHTDANIKIAALIEALGFSAIDLGPIDQGGRLQHFGGPLMVHNLIKY